MNDIGELVSALRDLARELRVQRDEAPVPGLERGALVTIKVLNFTHGVFWVDKATQHGLWVRFVRPSEDHALTTDEPREGAPLQFYPYSGSQVVLFRPARAA